MHYFRTFAVDLRKQIKINSFLVQVFLIFMVIVWTITPYQNSESTVQYLLDLFLGLSMPKKLVVLIATAKSVMLFLEEWQHGYTLMVLVRGDFWTYSVSKVISGFFASYFISFVSFVISGLLLSIKWPLITDQSIQQLIQNSVPHSYLLKENHILTFIFLPLMSYAVTIGLTTALMVGFSVFLTDKFTVLVSTFALNYALENIKWPEWIDFYRMSRGLMLMNLPLSYNWAIILVYSLFVILLSGIIFFLGLSKRVKYG